LGAGVNRDDISASCGSSSPRPSRSSAQITVCSAAISRSRKLWTDYTTPYRTFRKAIAGLGEREQGAIPHDTAARLYRI
jgi:hypothetical protein